MEERATHIFDTWYADAASFTGPTARRQCIAAIAAALTACERATLSTAASYLETQAADYEARWTGDTARQYVKLLRKHAAAIRALTTTGE